MNDSDQEPDLFTEALRLDLPNEGDEVRVRRRLVAAGVLAGAGAVVPGAAAAASAGSGLFAKIAALPLALKVGASVVALGVASVPVLDQVSSSEHEGTAKARTAAVSPVASPLPARVVPAEPRAGEPSSEPRVVPAEPAVIEPVALAPNAAPRAPANAGVEPLPRGEAVPASAPAPAPAPSPLAAVGSFPTVEAKPIDEGTLRAETALMERALAALQRGDVAASRRLLAEHAAKFPDGHLKRERERALERTVGKESEP